MLIRQGRVVLFFKGSLVYFLDAKKLVVLVLVVHTRARTTYKKFVDLLKIVDVSVIEVNKFLYVVLVLLWTTSTRTTSFIVQKNWQDFPRKFDKIYSEKIVDIPVVKSTNFLYVFLVWTTSTRVFSCQKNRQDFPRKIDEISPEKIVDVPVVIVNNFFRGKFVNFSDTKMEKWKILTVFTVLVDKVHSTTSNRFQSLDIFHPCKRAFSRLFMCSETYQ